MRQVTDDQDWEEYFEGYVQKHPEITFMQVAEHIAKKLSLPFEEVVSNEDARSIIDSIWDTGNLIVSATDLLDEIAEELSVSTKDLLLDPRDSKMINALYKQRVREPNTTRPFDILQAEQFPSDMSERPASTSPAPGYQSSIPASGSHSAGNTKQPSKQSPDTQNTTQAERVADLIKIVFLIARKMAPDSRRKFSDGINAIVKQVAGRLGQTQFRKALFDHYGRRCLITGCTVLHVVEAAHIRPYKSKGDFMVDNGLPLRSDLHMLFDQNLLAFHPETLKVELHPKLMGTDYECFLGQALKVDKMKPGPNHDALQERYHAFVKARDTADYSYAEPAK